MPPPRSSVIEKSNARRPQLPRFTRLIVTARVYVCVCTIVHIPDACIANARASARLHARAHAMYNATTGVATIIGSIHYREATIKWNALPLSVVVAFCRPYSRLHARARALRSDRAQGESGRKGRGHPVRRETRSSNGRRGRKSAIGGGFREGDRRGGERGRREGARSLAILLATR